MDLCRMRQEHTHCADTATRRKLSDRRLAAVLARFGELFRQGMETFLFERLSSETLQLVYGVDERLVVVYS